jgi:predicted lipid-binding transport protein (Tim44 family)
MDPGMTGGWWGGLCPWCGGTGRLFGGGLFSGLLGLLFMSLMMLVPLVLLILLILGVVWLVRSTSKTTPPSAPAQSCLYCGRELG